MGVHRNRNDCTYPDKDVAPCCTHPKYITVSFFITILKFTRFFDCRVILGGEIYYRPIGRPWGPAADSLTLSMSSSICLPRGRLLSSIRGPLARAIPKFVCPTVRLPGSHCPSRSGPGPGCLQSRRPGGRLHYPRHRRVPLTRSLHTRSESSRPGATGRPATLAAREVASQVSPPVHHHDPPAAHPSRPSVRPSESDSPVCHESAPGQPAGPGSARPCVRPVRSCYPTRSEKHFDSGPGKKKKHKGPVSRLPSGRNETNRNTKECGAGLADTV